jgi:NAD(P)-dependent dehydrogenase (short-subunit alcohol dehydrogenase family)
MPYAPISASPAPRHASLLAAAQQRLATRDRRNTCAAWRQRLAAMVIVAGATFATGARAQTAPDPGWTAADMPSQAGRIYVVTGGTSGMGFEDARALAAAGARVVIAARNPDRGDEAIARIRAETPAAELQFEHVDLADLESVRALASRLRSTLPRIDGLINNAAIMAPPERGVSPQGLEAQFATNYAGHFVLTAELLPLLRRSDAARVVTLSSIAALRGRIDFDDLQSERGYEPMVAYAQSKLACLMFARELQRRSDAAGWGLQSLSRAARAWTANRASSGPAAASTTRPPRRARSRPCSPPPRPTPSAARTTARSGRRRSTVRSAWPRCHQPRRTPRSPRACGP